MIVTFFPTSDVSFTLHYLSSLQQGQGNAQHGRQNPDEPEPLRHVRLGPTDELEMVMQMGSS